MRQRELFITALLFASWMLILSGAKSAGEGTRLRSFTAKGTVMELKPDARTVVIQHEAISNYMAAMTMPFKAPDSVDLDGLQRGDEITFHLNVTDSASWVDHIVKIGSVPLPSAAAAQPPEKPAVFPHDPLLDYPFTNELGQAVRLTDFHGHALAVTFFYTRCPLPDYCPRLSKNFEQACEKLRAQAGGPTNWHFLSITFDPEFDTPDRLKIYAESYQYDPHHWNFVTGPADKIAELTRRSGVTYESDTGIYNHNFRTLIIDANGHLQNVFPTSGDLSDEIVAEMIKAASVTSPPDLNIQNP